MSGAEAVIGIPRRENDLKRTYTMAASPMGSVSWEEYSGEALREWSMLLSDSSRPEADFQRFLEDNPSFVPCNWGELPLDQYYVPGESQPVEGHHGPLNSALITQPRLTGLDGKTPDFLWLIRDSGTVYAVLIEIETPTKRWFTEKGHPRRPPPPSLTSSRNLWDGITLLAEGMPL